MKEQNFEVTEAWIRENSLSNGHWLKSQLRYLGVNFPPKEGWIKLVEGKKISPKLAHRFERAPELYEKNRVLDIRAIDISELTSQQVLILRDIATRELIARGYREWG